MMQLRQFVPGNSMEGMCPICRERVSLTLLSREEYIDGTLYTLEIFINCDSCYTLFGTVDDDVDSVNERLSSICRLLKLPLLEFIPKQNSIERITQ